MGYASLFEDTQNVKFEAFTVAERLKVRDVAADKAEKLVGALLKRCKYVQDAKADISSLHSDLSKDTRNRIYSMRVAVEEANDRIKSLESELEAERELNRAMLQRRETFKQAQPPLCRRGRTFPHGRRPPRGRKSVSFLCRRRSVGDLWLLSGHTKLLPQLFGIRPLLRGLCFISHNRVHMFDGERERCRPAPNLRFVEGTAGINESDVGVVSVHGKVFSRVMRARSRQLPTRATSVFRGGSRENRDIGVVS